MMENTVILAVPLWAVICLGILSAAEKSHNVWLTRVEKPTVNDSWLQIHNMELKKLDGNKNARSVSMNFTLLQDLDSLDFMCELKTLQKAGGKYVKSPIDYPKKPCCTFFKDYQSLWKCVQDRSNLEEQCPLQKGFHWIKEVNPDLCNPADFLPPNLPEEYKAVLSVTKDYDVLVRMVLYGLLKRKMSMG